MQQTFALPLRILFFHFSFVSFLFCVCVSVCWTLDSIRLRMLKGYKCFGHFSTTNHHTNIVTLLFYINIYKMTKNKKIEKQKKVPENINLFQ